MLMRLFGLRIFYDFARRGVSNYGRHRDIGISVVECFLFEVIDHIAHIPEVSQLFPSTLAFRKAEPFHLIADLLADDLFVEYLLNNIETLANRVGLHQLLL